MSDVQTIQVQPDDRLPQKSEVDTSGYQAVRDDAAEAADEALRKFEARGQTFRMRKQIAAAVLLDLSVVGDKSTPQVDQLRAMRTFLDATLEPEDQAEFSLLLRRAEPPIEFEELGKIIEKMVEKISKNPTQQPESSSG